MSGEHNVNVSTEALDRIKTIVDDAFERMSQSSKVIRDQANTAGIAYQGSGTATMVDSYTGLGGAAGILSDALNGLLSDVGLTSSTAHETDASAQGEANRGAYQGGGGATPALF